MSRSGAGSPDGDMNQPVERFKPTSGGFVGWTGILLTLGVICYVVLDMRTLGGLRLAMGAAFGAVLLWATQLRPRVTAYPRHLRLHGPVRDTLVPYLAINEVALGQVLHVRVGTRRYVCVGIGRSVGYEMRQRVRSQGQGQGAGGMGGNRSYEFAGREQISEFRDSSKSYASFVLDRINHFVAAARAETGRAGAEPGRPEVSHRYAVPELVALVVTGVVFVVSLLL